MSRPAPCGAGRLRCVWPRWCSGGCVCCPAGRAAVCAGGRRPAAWPAAPRVFRAPEGPAAREARRPHFVRRRASKPARALRALRTCGAWCVDVRFGASARCPARPRHRPRAPQPGTPGSPAPSAPVVPGAGEGCAQTADHFGENGRNWGVSGEVVCVLGTLWLWARRRARYGTSRRPSMRYGHP